MAEKDKEVVIRVRGLVNIMGGNLIHDHIDLDVYRGEVLGVVGGSGAGKSVLLHSIVGRRRHGPSLAAGRRRNHADDLQIA